jgi:hypothetical protein
MSHSRRRLTDWENPHAAKRIFNYSIHSDLISLMFESFWTICIDCQQLCPYILVFPSKSSFQLIYCSSPTFKETGTMPVIIYDRSAIGLFVVYSRTMLLLRIWYGIVEQIGLLAFQPQKALSFACVTFWFEHFC